MRPVAEALPPDTAPDVCPEADDPTEVVVPPPGEALPLAVAGDPAPANPVPASTGVDPDGEDEPVAVLEPSEPPDGPAVVDEPDVPFEEGVPSLG